ncbi:MAG: hypothetical protein J5896_04135 [Alphaproteobacteria bacterium]|nr:hypothetical protein [Alphaproteobacteria bacterium]
MKSVLITILLFAAVLLAMYFHVFDIMSSSLAYYISAGLLIIVLLIALKTFGSPFAHKGKDHEKN